MLAYIYHIKNTTNGKEYIGQTKDIQKRLYNHWKSLEQNQHHSIKLQRAYNKYGKDVFSVSFKEVNVKNDDELFLLEKQEIHNYDSFNNGYNMTLGGEGNANVIDFYTCVLLYNILQKYQGVHRQIARFYQCDHTVIDSLANNTLYKNIEYDNNDLEELIKKLNLSNDNLNENYIAHNEKKLNKEQCFEILAILLNKKNYEKLLASIFKVDPTCIGRLKRKIIYKEYIQEFEKLTDEEKENIFLKTMNKYNLEHQYSQRQRACIKNALTQEQINFILDNKDEYTRIAIAKKLGISKDRVSNVILGKSYKDLVNNYYKSKEVK